MRIRVDGVDLSLGPSMNHPLLSMTMMAEALFIVLSEVSGAMMPKGGGMTPTIMDVAGLEALLALGLNGQDASMLLAVVVVNLLTEQFMVEKAIVPFIEGTMVENSAMQATTFESEIIDLLEGLLWMSSTPPRWW
ncbi:hypothetical protein GUJ93_ZPchr0004g38351 [Zizania palustris]|uniref:Uncharacterized protein n=1 Tax=Zizania palustris TaxID=103762 RepID=A0A8J5SCB5_ZIZPA|nr:hypothetical protein GUJ93_ZPchr0004g38351 [Zizania palustris]